MYIIILVFVPLPVSYDLFLHFGTNIVGLYTLLGMNIQDACQYDHQLVKHVRAITGFTFNLAHTQYDRDNLRYVHVHTCGDT